MSDAYAVSPAHLTATSTTLRTAAAGIESELQRCGAEVRGLDGVWTGQSHAHYATLYQEWQSSAARLQLALEGIASMTARAAEVYASGDASVASMLNRL
jgi:WXG100 family type VII secretion target